MASQLSRAALASCCATRAMHTSMRRSAISQFKMPAMSPTMTEGGIASWKKREREAFTVGDILLEIETDKATMDVEAQDDGIMGKIIAPDGSKAIPVGKTIALLAEEGDDISDLKVPAEESSDAGAAASAEPSPPPKSSIESAPPPPSESQTASSHHTFHPKSSRPIFPSVLRLLQENNLAEDVDSIGIKGTGVRGMLTKGDVLAFLGKAQGPSGTYKMAKKEEAAVEKAVKKEEPPKPFTADEVRKLIVLGMERRVKPVQAPTTESSFDSILEDYVKSSASSLPKNFVPLPTKPSLYLDGLF